MPILHCVITSTPLRSFKVQEFPALCFSTSLKNYTNVEIFNAKIESVPNLMNKVNQNSCTQHHKKETTCINIRYNNFFCFKQHLFSAIKNLNQSCPVYRCSTAFEIYIKIMYFLHASPLLTPVLGQKMTQINSTTFSYY